MDECENLVIDLEDYEEALNAEIAETMGQSESKKKSKNNGPETKGTAMSFGFKKKTNNTPKKKNLLKEKGNVKAIETKFSDKNGNTDSTEEINNENNEITWAKINHGNVSQYSNNKEITSGNIKGGNETNIGGGSSKNRFGFRNTNIVRPASTGISPKNLNESQENTENNNVSILNKRRSKSATGVRSVTSNRLNNDQQISTTTGAASTTTTNTNQQVRFSDVPKINTYTTDSSEYNPHWRQNERQQKLSDVNKMQFFSNQYYSNSNSRSTFNNNYGGINLRQNSNPIIKPTPVPSSSPAGKFTLHTASLPKPQYPVPVSVTIMDIKSAKQIANNNRKGFFAPREISTDSGISSVDSTPLENNNSKGPASNNAENSHLKKQRPRNLEMVMSGRHKFEVRDLDALSCESIEPLALPKLPSIFSNENQMVPSGLVRANSTLTSIQNTERNDLCNKFNKTISRPDNTNEEKLHLDRSSAEKHTAKMHNETSKNSSPTSSAASWCNAGESLALKDCSSISLGSSDESRNDQNMETYTIQTEEISSITLPEHPSQLSSITETVPNVVNKEPILVSGPKSLANIAETKFAEMAAAVSDILLDDETSPTDSLVSNSGSEDIKHKSNKKKPKTEELEKDIDEISPELDMCSPLSPGSPTQASNSLSLSDIGKDFLIDDEIADQPALLFNDKKNDKTESMLMATSLTDTSTLMDGSMRKSSPKSLSKNLMQAAIELSLRTPISLRKATLLGRAESLDTLSPCESIASDDLMMDFETSSMDSIDRISLARSINDSAAHILDETEIFAELETKGDDMIREWNNILKVHRTGKDSIISHLPARATRLLYRSRLQQQEQVNNTGSDSPKSIDSFPRKPPSSRTSSLHYSNKDTTSSSDDLLLNDKSFRNSMIQDVLYFKKQLLRLRRILQEDEESLTRTDTLNPFEAGNGNFFVSACGNYDTVDRHRQQNLNKDDKHLGSLQSLTSVDDPLQELADLRRQVVYLQGQVDDRERTIRLQKNLIDKLEYENEKCQTISASTSFSEKEVVNSATQTERIRPISIGPEGLARSKPEYTSYTVNLPISSTTDIKSILPNSLNQYQSSRRHTVISTTFTNLNRISQSAQNNNNINNYESPRRASIAWEKIQYKPVKTTFIGEIQKPIVLSKLNTISNNNSINISSSNKNNNNNNNCNGILPANDENNKIIDNNNIILEPIKINNLKNYNQKIYKINTNTNNNNHNNNDMQNNINNLNINKNNESCIDTLIKNQEKLKMKCNLRQENNCDSKNGLISNKSSVTIV